MSGGSYDYICHRVDDVADNLLNQKSSLRRAFGAHLKDVAKALHDIEWVDSGDYGTGDELEAIKKALGKDYKQQQIEIMLDDARKLIDELKALGA